MITPDELLTITRLSLALGEVERRPTHADGRHETDTTHSVMLALAAAAAAHRMGLDPGRAALFALVHDLAEVYAGDTDTSMGLGAEARAAKAAREAAATERIIYELGDMGCLIALLQDYDRREEPEARLVALLDKAMPKAVRVVVEREALGLPALLDYSPAATSQAGRLREEFSEAELLPIHELSDELRRRLFAADGAAS